VTIFFRGLLNIFSLLAAVYMAYNLWQVFLVLAYEHKVLFTGSISVFVLYRIAGVVDFAIAVFDEAGVPCSTIT